MARFLSDRSGSTAIEYALIGGFIFLAIVVGLTVVGESLNQTFTTVDKAFPK